MRKLSLTKAITLVVLVALISSVLTLIIIIKTMKLINTTENSCLLSIGNQTYYYEK